MEPENHLIKCMGAEDRVALLGMSELVRLSARQKLAFPGSPIPFVYFLRSGLVSLSFRAARHAVAEIDIVGPEGCTDSSVLLGVNSVLQGAIVEVPGSAWRVATADIRALLENRKPLRQLLLRFVHTQMVQRSETTMAACSATIQQRLSRLLLMAHDRLRTDELPLTHEAISTMLCVRRSSVTVALHELRGCGFIGMCRGHITLLNRAGLAEVASPYYGTSAAEYERLFGSLCAPATPTCAAELMNQKPAVGDQRTRKGIEH